MSFFSDHDINLTNEQEAQFEKLLEVFIDWNSKINLSAIRDREGVYLKHFVDSLLATKHLDFNDKKMADLGTGGGFPALPLGIVTEGTEIHGFDSVGKKLKAVQAMADQLGLNIKTFHGRLEDFGQKPKFREQYDLVTTRALAEWETLMEYALPFVKVGGSLVAYQGPAILEKINPSPRPPSLPKKEGGVCRLLGGEIVNVWEERLVEDTRVIIEIEKVEPTPKKYPREVGVPKGKPLS